MFRKIEETLKITPMRVVMSIYFAVLIGAAMVFVGVALTNGFNRTFTRSVTKSSYELMDQVKINLDTYLYNMMDLSDLLAVKISGNSGYSTVTIDELFEPIIRTRRDVKSITLFDENGDLLNNIGDKELQPKDVILNQEWYKKIKYAKQYIYISEPHVQQLAVGEYPWVISISRRVGFRQEGVYKEGILLIDMNFSAIENLLESVNLSDKGYVFIVNGDNELVYHNEQQLIYAGIKAENLRGIENSVNDSFLQIEEERYITSKLLDNVDWKLVGVYYTSDIMNSRQNMTEYIGWIIIIGVVIFTGFSLFMSARITKPLQELEISMKKVEDGKFDEHIEIRGEQEVVQLTKSYNLMIRKIRALMDQIVVEQEAKRKSELSSLQAQINPHFLYNTLDSIIWMAEHEKHDEVILMTNSLASLFRISISRGEMIIPVEKEFNHAKNYLTIQKMRYKDKFTFSFEIDEEIYRYEILKLVLQPIIENAIYHGIRHMVDEGEIIIRGYLTDDHLVFEVEDDGLGMDEETSKTVLFTDTKLRKTGVGLNNVHERIQLCYGKDYGLTIESEIEEGTKIKYLLPRNEVKS